MTLRFLVDTSVWVRVPRQPTIRKALSDAVREGQVVLAPPVVLELGFSARNLADWDGLHKDLAAFPVLPLSERSHEIATTIQRALWGSGKVRAPGAMDTLIAATAVEHDVVLVHYDRDYEHLAGVEPRLRHRWAVGRGSVA